MSDRIVYRCNVCQVATVAGQRPPEHHCPVCNEHEWIREGVVD